MPTPFVVAEWVLPGQPCRPELPRDHWQLQNAPPRRIETSP